MRGVDETDPRHIRMSLSKYIGVELYDLAQPGLFLLGEEGTNVDESVCPVEGHGL